MRPWQVPGETPAGSLGRFGAPQPPRGHGSVPSYRLSARVPSPACQDTVLGRQEPPGGRPLGTGLCSKQGAALGRPRLTASSCIFSSSRAVFLFREISLSLLLKVSEQGEAFGDGGTERGDGRARNAGTPSALCHSLPQNPEHQLATGAPLLPNRPAPSQVQPLALRERGRERWGYSRGLCGAHPSFRVL